MPDFRKPETVRIELARGRWLLVKKFLTAGETRRIFRRMIKAGAGGNEIEPTSVGISKMVVYLVDWSLVDADERPVVIRGQSEETIGLILDNLDTEAFTEILHAIEDHEAAMDQERLEEKKIPITEPRSSLTSPSPAPLVGATTG